LADHEHVARSVAHNRAEMARLVAGLRDLGLGYIPSVGNFVTVDFDQPAGPVDRALLSAGVICRPVANYGLPNHLRVSIGLDQENTRLLETLEEVLRS
jgi:histidinol-phosphate aminotransferase